MIAGATTLTHKRLRSLIGHGDMFSGRAACAPANLDDYVCFALPSPTPKPTPAHCALSMVQNTVSNRRSSAAASQELLRSLAIATLPSLHDRLDGTVIRTRLIPQPLPLNRRHAPHTRHALQLPTGETAPIWLGAGGNGPGPRPAGGLGPGDAPARRRSLVPGPLGWAPGLLEPAREKARVEAAGRRAGFGQ
jgi:hypothetical protein